MKYTYKQAAEIMKRTHERDYGPGHEIGTNTCPGLSCEKCPFKNYVDERRADGLSCELVNNPAIKGQSAYKIAIARAVGEKLDLI